MGDADTGAWPADKIDHADQNKLNNRWANLLEATQQDNMRNRKGWAGRSLPKGVAAHRNRFTATCCINYRNIYIGIFGSPEEAHAAYCDFVSKHHGAFFSGG